MDPGSQVLLRLQSSNFTPLSGFKDSFCKIYSSLAFVWTSSHFTTSILEWNKQTKMSIEQLAKREKRDLLSTYYTAHEDLIHVLILLLDLSSFAALWHFNHRLTLIMPSFITQPRRTGRSNSRPSRSWWMKCSYQTLRRRKKLGKKLQFLLWCSSFLEFSRVICHFRNLLIPPSTSQGGQWKICLDKSKLTSVLQLKLWTSNPSPAGGVDRGSLVFTAAREQVQLWGRTHPAQLSPLKDMEWGGRLRDWHPTQNWEVSPFLSLFCALHLPIHHIFLKSVKFVCDDQMEFEWVLTTHTTWSRSTYVFVTRATKSLNSERQSPARGVTFGN